MRGAHALPEQQSTCTNSARKSYTSLAITFYIAYKMSFTRVGTFYLSISSLRLKGSCSASVNAKNRECEDSSSTEHVQRTDFMNPGGFSALPLRRYPYNRLTIMGNPRKDCITGKTRTLTSLNIKFHFHIIHFIHHLTSVHKLVTLLIFHSSGQNLGQTICNVVFTLCNVRRRYTSRISTISGWLL